MNYVFSETDDEMPARRYRGDALHPRLSSVDELVRQTGTTPGTVQMALLELEIAGRLERHAGGRVSLA